MDLGGSRRTVRPVFRIRLDEAGHGYLLFDVPQNAASAARLYHLLRFEPEGSFAEQYAFGVNASGIRTWQIMDFAPDHRGGLYLLELLERDSGELVRRLRRLDGQGNEVWARSGDLDLQVLDFDRLAGKLENVLAPDADSLYLPARYPHEDLARLDPADGRVLDVYSWDEPSDKVTIGPSGDVYYSRMLDQGRVLIRRNVTSGDRVQIEPDFQAWDDLAGVDADGRIYARTGDGIARLSPTGSTEWQESVHGAVVRAADRHVFIGRGGSGELVVEHYDESGEPVETLRFSLEGTPLAADGETPDLVAVDEGFSFYGGESNRDAGTLATFDPDGRLRAAESLGKSFDRVNEELAPIETRTGGAGMLEVDRSGGVYVPLSDPEGFKVIRMQPTGA